jgi:thiosulfate/3-mercaptopyruvate sulfurtransferase
VDRAVFHAKPPADTICRLDDVAAAIDRDDVVIWDVRSPAEYTGEDPRTNKRGGHISGAVHLEWLELTAPPARSGLLLPAGEIKRKLETVGITPDKLVYTH